LTAWTSTPEDLALHGVRVSGFATAARVASRYGLDPDTVEELLLDDEAVGWVRRSSFVGSPGWSMTDAGRGENERRLAAELDLAGARDVVTAAHAAFLPLNRRFGVACTDWQVRPSRLDPLALNDHTDPRWDDRVLDTLAGLHRSFRELTDRLAASLTRFDGYADRYAVALAHTERGRHAWVDAPDRDSLHLVWMQFHEDLRATLGIEPGADA
jgi:hypothetical protein